MFYKKIILVMVDILLFIGYSSIENLNCMYIFCWVDQYIVLCYDEIFLLIYLGSFMDEDDVLKVFQLYLKEVCVLIFKLVNILVEVNYEI